MGPKRVQGNNQLPQKAKWKSFNARFGNHPGRSRTDPMTNHKSLNTLNKRFIIQDELTRYNGPLKDKNSLKTNRKQFFVDGACPPQKASNTSLRMLEVTRLLGSRVQINKGHTDLILRLQNNKSFSKFHQFGK